MLLKCFIDTNYILLTDDVTEFSYMSLLIFCLLNLPISEKVVFLGFKYGHMTLYWEIVIYNTMLIFILPIKFQQASIPALNILEKVIYSHF